MKAKKNVPELRFPGFENEWEEKKLGEISTLTSSKRIFFSDYVNEGVPFYRGKEITELKAGKKINDLLFISLAQYIQIKTEFGVPQHGDILITAVGTLGNVYRVDNDAPFYFKDGNLIWIKDFTQHSRFIEVYLDAKKSSVIATAIGSSQKALTIVELNKLKLILPSVPEQEKIADFLSDMDLKIAKLSRKNELMREYKRGIMQKLFSQELRFKDANGEDYPDWEEKRLGEVIKYTPRKIDKPSYGYWRLGLRSHCKGTFHTFIDDPAKIDMDELYVVKENDLIVNITFAWEHAIAIADSSDNGKLVSHRFPTYILTSEVYVKYMKYLIAQRRFKYELENISPGGAGRNRVMSKSDFLEIIIFLPKIPEQEKIANFLGDIDQKIEQIQMELSAVKQFKKGLLQKMFV